MTDLVAKGINWVLFAMVIVAVYNALMRYLGRGLGVDLSSNFFLELQWYFFSLIFLFAAANGLKTGRHVRVDVFYSNFSRGTQAKIDLVGGTLFLLPFCALIVFLAFPSVIGSWAILEGSSDPNGLPRYPIKTAVILAFFLLFLQGGSEIIKSIARIRGENGAEND